SRCSRARSEKEKAAVDAAALRFVSEKLFVHDFQFVTWRKFTALLRFAEGAIIVFHFEVVDDRGFVRRHRHHSFPAIADAKRWAHRKKIVTDHNERFHRAGDL